MEKKKRQTDQSPPKKKRAEQSMPFNQVRSMFSEKMKAIMMQDRGQLRKIFQRYDVDKKGVLTAQQFCQLCKDYEMGLSSDEAKAFMAQFTSGKPFMSFQDFFQNL